MATRTPRASVYLEFLALSQDALANGGFPELDPLEERILATVALANAQEERLCVRDLMARSEFGAPATIHARLKSMRENGWLKLGETEDARRKQVELDTFGRKYLSRLSRLMGRAARAAH